RYWAVTFILIIYTLKTQGVKIPPYNPTISSSQLEKLASFVSSSFHSKSSKYVLLVISLTRLFWYWGSK
ncbi:MULTISPECIES: hypothetical protein, partial [Streptococcus]|uniref:hypothetical protein n=2 Tax=Streptococcus TaxID=1301 RepID=UPI001963011E